MANQQTWEEIERDTLTATNAQIVFQHLKNLEARRDRVQTRWIWELLQNARDASPDDHRSLVCSIEHEADKVLFQHNGRPFKLEEIARVIYHGSTKAEDESSIGQYGSGLLTTHLLAPEVEVSGTLDDGGYFNFPLRREAITVPQMHEFMKAAADKFRASLSTTMSSVLSDGFTTRFLYPFEDANSPALVSQGISRLEIFAPLILAFNSDFKSITIKEFARFVSFEIVDEVDVQGGSLRETTVRKTKDDTWTEVKYLLANHEKTSVAVPICEDAHEYSCQPIVNFPRLFLGLPLVGTENFSFPVVVNSFRFTPADGNRDGVNLWITANDKENIENQAALTEAGPLLLNLATYAAAAVWKNTYELAYVPPVINKDWYEVPDLKDHLEEQLIGPLRKTPIVVREYGDGPVPPEDSVIPFAEDNDGIDTLWYLLSHLNEFHTKLPRREEAVGWYTAVNSWATIGGRSASDFDEVVDGRKLASMIEVLGKDSNIHRFGKLSNLEMALRDDVCATRWLNDVLKFLKSSDLVGQMDDRSIVLDQAGNLDRLSNLYFDRDIDEELKVITDELELNLRDVLIDKRLTAISEDDARNSRDNQKAIQDIIEKLKEIATEDDLDESFAIASLGAFSWIVRNEEWDLLRGFPTFAEENKGERTVIWLPQSGQIGALVPLAPVRVWQDDLQQFSVLFPPPYIMSPGYFDAVSDPEAWQKLANNGLVRTSILTENEDKPAAFLPDEPLPDVEGDARHEANNPVGLSGVAFLRGRRTAILERARGSQRRARLFWRFVTEWLIVHDKHALNMLETSCACGESHRYYRGDWLERVARYSWVPLEENKHARATAENLAGLLRESDAFPIPEGEGINNLLEAIGVSRFDLMRESVDKDSRPDMDIKLIRIMAAADNSPEDLDVVPTFLAQLKQDENLPKYLEERVRERQTIRRNQQVGLLVEDLVRKSLELEGFNVEKTHVGADLIIRFASGRPADLSQGKVTEDDVTQLEVSKDGRIWLVEVKATSMNHAQMSPAQARTAVRLGKRFLLCVLPVKPDVVPGLDDVRTDLRFVEEMGDRVSEPCAELRKFEEGREELVGEYPDGVRLTVSGGNTRIGVAKAVWENEGFPLNELPLRIS